MPFKLNVGASRKVTDNNYGSRGASINLEMEVDSSLVGEPAKLHERIRQLFGVVRVSLAEELNGGNGLNNGHSNGASAHSNGSAANPNGNGNGYAGATQDEKPRLATAAQVRAISAIANRRQLDLRRFLQNRIGIDKPAELTIKQASQVIDELKAAGAPSGG